MESSYFRLTGTRITSRPASTHELSRKSLKNSLPTSHNSVNSSQLLHRRSWAFFWHVLAPWNASSLESSSCHQNSDSASKNTAEPPTLIHQSNGYKKTYVANIPPDESPPNWASWPSWQPLKFSPVIGRLSSIVFPAIKTIYFSRLNSNAMTMSPRHPTKQQQQSEQRPFCPTLLSPGYNTMRIYAKSILFGTTHTTQFIATHGRTRTSFFILLLFSPDVLCETDRSGNFKYNRPAKTVHPFDDFPATKLCLVAGHSRHDWNMSHRNAVPSSEIQLPLGTSAFESWINPPC